ncbi:MAG: PLP-dependent aminotransferase family protein [Lachnospiraceae bacterium]|nr:PLP-dependent aminotransferase family protein [Lachnospiraceae bacterium]
MLIYDLEGRGSKPLYEYLYECIRDDITRGVLTAGEKLPSKRTMAKDHGIALITVENAYAQLIIEGYVTAREKSGYFVNADMVAQNAYGEVVSQTVYGEVAARNSHGHADKAAVRNAHGHADKAAGSALQADLPKDLKREGAEKPRREPFVDFSSSKLKKDAFPFATWTKLMRRVLDDREEAFLEKPESRGVRELREAIATYLRKAKGLDVDPDRIFVGPGTEYLHHLILQLVGASRIVAVEDPGYKKVGQIYESHGLKCLHVPVDENGLMVERLQGSNAKLVHLSPSHHFPTGCVMPISRRRSLLEWAKEQGAYLVEDDYDGEFRFDGKPVPTLASLDDETVIYLNTFTKTLAPSIRIAYMVLPRRLKEQYEEKLAFYSGAVSSFDQYTLAAFIGEGSYERHVNRMRNYYRQQRTKILGTLAESSLGEKVLVEEHSAGLHFILKVNGIRDDGAFLQRLEEKGIRLMPVAAYCYGGQERYRHQFVIYYSDLEEKNLREAFEIMAEEIKINTK